MVVGSKKLKKTKGNYCFPNFLGKLMKSVGPRVQFESSLLSMSFIMIGIILMTIITIFGTDFSLLIKILAGVNGIAAFVFLSSYLITTFQQYQGYLAVMDLLLEEEETEIKHVDVDNITKDNLKENKLENLKDNNII